MAWSNTIRSKKWVCQAKKTQPQQTKGKESERHDAKSSLVFVRDVHQAYNDGQVDVFEKCLHEDVHCSFKGALMLRSYFVEQMRLCTKAFPDFNFTILHSRAKPSAMEDCWDIVCDLRVNGTHTGAPYCFDPYPPIAATGISLKMDVERVTYTVSPRRRKSRSEVGSTRRSESKIDDEFEILHMRVVPLGEFTGPVGMYTQLGGVIF